MSLTSYVVAGPARECDCTYCGCELRRNDRAYEHGPSGRVYCSPGCAKRDAEEADALEVIAAQYEQDGERWDGQS